MISNHETSIDNFILIQEYGKIGHVGTNSQVKATSDVPEINFYLLGFCKRFFHDTLLCYLRQDR